MSGTLAVLSISISQKDRDTQNRTVSQFTAC